MIPKRQQKVNRERHKRIKLALIQQNKTFSQVAEKCKVTGGCVSNVSHGHYFIPRIAKALAAEAGIPYGELWPEKVRAAA